MWRADVGQLCVKVCLCAWPCLQPTTAHICPCKSSSGPSENLYLLTTPWSGATPRTGATAPCQKPGRRARNRLASWHQRRPGQTGETSETQAHIKAPPSGMRSVEASMLSLSAGVWAPEALSHLHLERESEGSLMVSIRGNPDWHGNSLSPPFRKIGVDASLDVMHSHTGKGGEGRRGGGEGGGYSRINCALKVWPSTLKQKQVYGVTCAHLYPLCGAFSALCVLKVLHTEMWERGMTDIHIFILLGKESFDARDTVWAGVKTLFPKDGKDRQGARQFLKGLFCTNSNVTETHLFFILSHSFCAYHKSVSALNWAATPLLFSRVPLMLHTPLDVFSSWDRLRWPISSSPDSTSPRPSLLSAHRLSFHQFHFPLFFPF